MTRAARPVAAPLRRPPRGAPPRVAQNGRDVVIDRPGREHEATPRSRSFRRPSPSSRRTSSSRSVAGGIPPGARPRTAGTPRTPRSRRRRATKSDAESRAECDQTLMRVAKLGLAVCERECERSLVPAAKFVPRVCRLPMPARELIRVRRRNHVVERLVEAGAMPPEQEMSDEPGRAALPRECERLRGGVVDAVGVAGEPRRLRTGRRCGPDALELTAPLRQRRRIVEERPSVRVPHAWRARAR